MKALDFLFFLMICFFLDVHFFILFCICKVPFSRSCGFENQYDDQEQSYY